MNLIHVLLLISLQARQVHLRFFFITILLINYYWDYQDKWRNLNQRKGGCRDGYKPQKDIEKAIIPFNEYAALTTEARDKDEITQAEGVATVHKSWDDGDSNKLISR